MLNVGLPEAVLIAIVALLVVGPERLPGLARSAAQMLSRFRGEARKSLAELRAAADLEDVADEVSSLRRELRATRDDVAGALRGGESGGASRDKPVSPGGPTPVQEDRATADAADDEPPPTDPEAT